MLPRIESDQMMPGERVHERVLPMMERMRSAMIHFGVPVLPSVYSTESVGTTQDDLFKSVLSERNDPPRTD